MKHLLIILCLFAVSNLSAQKTKVKYGNISKAEFGMKSCPFDEEAGAVVLSDVGLAWYNFGTSGSLELIKERHVRIKIFNNRGYDEADIEIPYYTGGDNNANISNLKAQTIRQVNGKEEVTKVEKSSFFDEETNEYNSKVKFSFPKIDDGVIIEYKYRLTTPYFSAMKLWHFQRDIPVLYTSYEAQIPDFYDCSVTVVGHNSSAITYSTTTSHTDDFLNNVHEFEGRDLPAMKNEKYGTNIRNYTTKARIIIRSYQIPGRFIEKVSGDYTEFNKTLLEYERYKQLDQGLNFLDDELHVIKRFDDSRTDISSIVEYVKKKTTFSKYYYFYPNQTARTTLKGESSNSAAINMLLTLLLQHAGYDAEPLIVGTRDYRKPHPFNPDFGDFNHLVAYVTLKNGKAHIYDATSKIKGGLPSSRVFNAQGWIVSKENGRNINLGEFGAAKVMVNSKWNVQPGGQSEVSMNVKANYLGIHALSDQDCYDATSYEKWLSENTSLKVEEFTAEENTKLTSMSYHYGVDDIDEKNIIYIEPTYHGFLDFEIFRREERNTPLDIPYKINVTNIVELNIPSGYVVETLPTPKKLTLGENNMKFSVLSTSDDKQISINVRFKIDRNFYLNDQYPDIRAFFGEIESALNEKIVLKKAE